MTEYLITDTLTGEKTWVAAASVRDALIARENELRATAGGGRRPGKPALPANAKASHYNSGSIIDVSIADVSCVGQKQAVTRVSEMTKPGTQAGLRD